MYPEMVSGVFQGENMKPNDQGKINFAIGNKMERDFILSPNVLSIFGLLLLTTKVVYNGVLTTGSELLGLIISTLIGWDKQPVKVATPLQGGNFIAADAMAKNGDFVNVKAIVDGGNTIDDLPSIQKVRTLKDRASHGSFEVGRGNGALATFELSRNEELELLLLVPYKVKGLAREGIYYAVSWNYSSYVRKCIGMGKWCNFKEGYDKTLLKVGGLKTPSEYGVLRRVYEEKLKIRSQKSSKHTIVCLEINPFSPKVQEIEPWKKVEMFEYTQGVFIHLPNMKPPQ